MTQLLTLECGARVANQRSDDAIPLMWCVTGVVCPEHDHLSRVIPPWVLPNHPVHPALDGVR